MTTDRGLWLTSERLDQLIGLGEATLRAACEDDATAHRHAAALLTLLEALRASVVPLPNVTRLVERTK